VKDASNGASARQVASKISVSPSSVAKWFRTGKPPAFAVVAIARLYDADVDVGFVAAGIMNVDDVQRAVDQRLRAVPTHMLLAELTRRGQEGTDGLKHGLAPERDHPSSG
jgi:hypothetical protein